MLDRYARAGLDQFRDTLGHQRDTRLARRSLPRDCYAHCRRRFGFGRRSVKPWKAIYFALNCAIARRVNSDSTSVPLMAARSLSRWSQLSVPAQKIFLSFAMASGFDA